ncbi:MAG: 2Fe-2S iron-sulfur cluster binding domain-containing protein [Emcibacter sp.]|nr:2Fe-2S iron-sulfur cluster binding domain-containing protein [Emcibacter sp.]
MVKITYIAADLTETTVEAAEGDSLMKVATTNGIGGIVGECGGYMMCATCHVYVDERFIDLLPPRSEEEDEMLESAASGRRDNSRLSCQIKACPEIEGIIVHMPEYQL